ncbi:MAG: acyl-CoA dehydrogenase [Pseudomonadota bacterium]
MSLIVNRRDLDFYLYELLGLETLLSAERFADYDRETVDSVLDAAEAIATDTFAPLAATLDANEPQFNDGAVTLIPEARAALDTYVESGFLAAEFDADVGGMQLPTMVNMAMGGMFHCANGPLMSYPFLTAGAANLLNVCGSDALKAKYLPNMLSGKWFGTMCLSETQAGSSLGDIRTRADAQADGSYHLTGSKMWISGGDHNLAENIVHMVLAKIPGGPPGVKGISLFLVPKIRVNDDGSLGDSNNVAAAGLNHKMGQRGTANCLLNFGESGDCVGYLVGAENAGLANMFHMMNEARIGVGLGAVMCGLGGYLYSLGYAKERTQGRPLGNKNPETPQIPIIEHSDIKRLLLSQKAFVEGGQSLILYCAQLVDEERLAADKAEQQRLALLLDLLTPIAKSWPSEYCLEANKMAIQILGGYGYTRDYPVERLYRDNRLNHIHEGSHGIQGLDILGRKVRMHGGAALAALAVEVDATLSATQSTASLAEYRASLEQAMQTVASTTASVAQCEDHALGLANATLFLDAFGHVVIAWLWLRQAAIAADRLAGDSQKDRAFYEGKLAACQFFYRYELPKAVAQLHHVASLDDTLMQVRSEHFAAG